MHKVQVIPGFTGFKEYLDTHYSRYTWIHSVRGIPGYTIFKVYLDTQG